MDTIADHLREHRFEALFTDLLGWEHATGRIDVSTGGRDFAFAAVAHKRGLQVLVGVTDRLALMNRGLLREVQKRVAAIADEHILICYCEQPRKQVWKWALRSPEGLRLRRRKYTFFSDRPPAPFLTRLLGLRFTLEEEEGLSQVQALEGVRPALDMSGEQSLFARDPRYAEQSDALAREMQTKGDVASFHRLVEFHLPLGRRISRRLCRLLRMLPDDAAQIAFLGLMQAARRFRPELGYRFYTYANLRVKQACGRLGPQFAFLIRLPVPVLGRGFRLRRELERLAVGVGMSGVREYLAELDLRDPKLGAQLRAFEAQPACVPSPIAGSLNTGRRGS